MEDLEIITVEGRELAVMLYADAGVVKLFGIRTTRQNKKSFKALMKIKEKLAATRLRSSLHLGNS